MMICDISTQGTTYSCNVYNYIADWEAHACISCTSLLGSGTSLQECIPLSEIAIRGT
jgi:hypothetical protein